MNREPLCSDCEVEAASLSRRRFVQAVGAATVGTTLLSATSVPRLIFADDAKPAPKPETPKPEMPKPEMLVKKLYDSFSTEQKEEICFAWDHSDDRGLLRTHVSNNWQITDVKKLNIAGKFFSKDQQDIIEAIFNGLYNPEWHARILQQIQDDAGGYGKQQTIALFGQPGTGKFEFVMTGRHLTIRCDGDSTEHVAFGGPIFYGHAAKGFNEEPSHPGNVFWHQALKANALFKMLDGKQREVALVQKGPQEAKVGFNGKAAKTGIAYSELAADQKTHLKGVLDALIEPYRSSDQQEVTRCLTAQGGLEACHLSFFKQDDKGNSVDLGDDGVWDNWRLEGPSFVWSFRGAPHVHVWVNIADDPNVTLNARG